MSLVQAQLLGDATATVDSRSIAFLPDMRYLLLAYLACRNDWVGREELASLFWPDVRYATARHRLRQLLKRVRQIDWPVGVEADLHRVRWAPRTDVAALRQALADGADDEAVRLYTGPLLRGLDGAAPSEYHRWLEFERRDLHDAWRSAVLRLGQRLQAEARPAEAADLYARVTADDPLDEEAVHARLRALAAAGEAGRALRTWNAFTDRLRLELGVEPRPAMQRLVDDIERAARDDGGERSAPSTAPRPPAPASPFVGRDTEIAAVAHLLGQRECRLLTVTGPGGVGKSRLAARAADELDRRYPDGVHLVPLERLRSGAEVPAAVAAAIEGSLLATPPGRAPASGDPPDDLRERLRDRRMLLVLDDFEHLAEDAGVLHELLETGSGIDILVTSRHRLGLEAEWLLPIEGLPWPPQDSSSEEALEFDAVRLFLACARRLGPYVPGPADLPHLRRICAAVHGVPLALELAAAWTRALPLHAIAERIERDLGFLGPRDERDGDRGTSVRAALDHSWRLLTDAERSAYAFLAAFPGPFRAAAAEAVAGVRLPVLAALIDKSLLRLDQTGRYDRHPLLRRYAAERLAERPREAAELRERHARFVLTEVESLRPRIAAPGEAGALGRLDELHDDVREALRWSFGRGESDVAIRICAALGRYWEVRGLAAEGLEFIERALELPNDDPGGQARAAALNAAGLLAWVRNEYRRAASFFEQALGLRRAARDRRGAAATLNNLGAIAADQGQLDSARSLHRRSLAIKRALGDERGVAMSLNNLGIVTSRAGDHAAAREFFEQSLAVMRACGHREGTIMALNNVGLEAEHAGDLVEAVSRFEEGLQLARGLGVQAGVARVANNLGRVRRRLGQHAAARRLLVEALDIRWRIGARLGVADSLDELAGLELDRGDVDRAIVRWGAAAALRDAVGAPTQPPKPHIERDQELASATLGAHEFATALARARATPIERVLEDVRAGEADAIPTPSQPPVRRGR